MIQNQIPQSVSYSHASALSAGTGAAAGAVAFSASGPNGSVSASASGAVSVDQGGVDASLSFSASGSWNRPLQLPLPRCYCPEPPPPPCPEPTLEVDEEGKIHTPGGYTVEATSQYTWKVTGPDGKSTTVWGDPHVAESDGGTWDFQESSSFVLPDGTTINVQTGPYGENGATVTTSLEVVNGDSRVEVTGIDQGAGQVGQVEQGGAQYDTAGWDQFVMGSETDDWAFGGREIVGSEDHGNVLKVGDPLAPGQAPASPPPAGSGSATSRLDAFYGAICRMLDVVKQQEQMQASASASARATSVAVF